MTTPGIDNYEWLDAVGEDPELTTIVKAASFSFIGAKVAGLTDEQLAESFRTLERRGYIETKLFLDDQAELRYGLRLPKVVL